MALRDALLPEFDNEMANTRRMLERVPDDKLDWTPHQKSWSFRGLVTHLANVPRWVVLTITEDGFDVAPEGGDAVREEPVESMEKALTAFDGNVAAAREALSGAEDDTLFANWALLKGGEPMFKMPRLGVLRTMVMNHMIHHRGQLSVYLRLNDVPLPPIYGPSADEES